jgi:hypothetical protein
MTPNADYVRYNSQQQRVEWRRGDMLIGWCASESVETVKAWLQYWGLPPIDRSELVVDDENPNEIWEYGHEGHGYWGAR